MKYNTRKLERASKIAGELGYIKRFGGVAAGISKREMEETLSFFDYRRVQTYTLQNASKQLGAQELFNKIYPILVNAETQETVDNLVELFRSKAIEAHGKERTDDAFDYSGALKILGFDK